MSGKSRLLGIGIAILLLAVFVGGVVWVFSRDYPDPPPFAAVKARYQATEAVLLDRHGAVLHELRIDPRARRLEWVRLADVSPSLIRVVIQAEDKRFYRHHGVDWAAMAASLFALRPRGASTITMQVAAILDPDLKPRRHRRGVNEKWRQIRAAGRLDHSWTKDEILEAYLNLITFRGEIQGIAAAARGLFDKLPSGLSLSEALVLAALIPSTNMPLDRIAARAVALGDALHAPSRPEEIRALVYARIGRPYRLRPTVALAPQVARQLLKQSGQRVMCTLDKDLQEYVLASLQHQLMDLRGSNVRDGAVLVVENASGDILAYIGNQGESASAPYVDGIKAPRQAGSSLKPFLYELALERRYLTAASLIDDTPLEIPTAVGLYVPENYSRDYQGPVSVRTALAASLNIPAVRTLLLVGPAVFVERLKALGFETVRQDADYYGYSLALGSVEIRLIDLVNAYRTLADGGIRRPLRLYATDRTGPARPVMAPEAVFIISDILSDREPRSVTFGLENALATSFWTAGKTGTSKDMRDNWCVGYSERYTVGVWVGNFSGDPMWNVSGVSGAAPVWREVMNYLHRTTPSPAPPPARGVRAKAVTFQGGIEPARREWFIAGTEPRTAITINARREAPAIAYPPDGAIFALDPDIPMEHQHIAFEATPPGNGYTWLLNGSVIGAQSPLLWKPIRGAYRLTLADKDRHPLATISFAVR